MTMKDERNSQRTASAMQDTADQLEQAEAILHRSAQASPAPAARDQLHRLGDQVTDEARDIARRAEAISGHAESPGSS